MSNINFTIRNIFPGTDAQKKVGIHATFSMTVDGPDGIIVALNDMKLMQTRDGTYYIDSAFRSYDKKDKETGQMTKAKISYAKLFPEKQNWDKKDAVVKLVLDELQNAGTKPQASAAAPKVAPSKDMPW